MIPANEVLAHQRRERLLSDFAAVCAAQTEPDHWKRSQVDWINALRLRLDRAGESDSEDLEYQYRSWLLVAAEAALRAEIIMRENDGALNFVFEIPDRPLKLS